MNDNSSELHSYSDAGKIAHTYNETNVLTGYYRINALKAYANSLLIDTELVDNVSCSMVWNVCNKISGFNDTTGYYQIGKGIVYTSSDTNDAIITNSIDENDIKSKLTLLPEITGLYKKS